MKRIIALLLVFTLVLVGCSTGVKQEDYDKLELKLSSSLEERDEREKDLTDKIIALQKENEELKDASSPLKNDVDSSLEATELEDDSVEESGAIEPIDDELNFHPLIKKLSPIVIPLHSDSGSEVGKYAYVAVTKDMFDIEGQAAFEYFVNTYVDGKKYNWITIDFGDGTGIVFNGSSTIYAAYGILNEKKTASTTLGDITLTVNGYVYEARD